MQCTDSSSFKLDEKLKIRYIAIDPSQFSAASTEPAKFPSSYITRSKEIVDMEIGMC
jgi:hypothetical protein